MYKRTDLKLHNYNTSSAMIKKFISARSGFYDQLLSLLLPIVFQNLITSAVSMADVLMLGRVNQTVLSASSLAGQVQFILNIIYFGLASALTILASQYWGRDDRPTIARIFGIGFLISVPVSTAVSVMALICPHWVISIWTNVPELASAGSSYLRWVAFSYFFMGITQPYLSVMKSCERVQMTTAVSVFTLCLNVVLNAVLIFGLCGLPQMGITGAALATSIARGVELFICLWDYARQKVFPRGIRLMFSIPMELAGDFGRYCLPAFINDAMWGLAFNMNSVIMGHLGSDIVAANSIVTVARDLVTTVGFGIAAASSIMLGKEIGSGNLSLARHDASSLLRTTVVVGVFEGLILLAISPIIPMFFKLSPTAAGYLRVMLPVNTVYQMGQIVNTLLIASLFRCGGDSSYGMKLDILCMWCFAVPLGLVSAFVLKLPPLVVYLLMCTDEFAKMPFALKHYFDGEWIRDLTREF